MYSRAASQMHHHYDTESTTELPAEGACSLAMQSGVSVKKNKKRQSSASASLSLLVRIVWARPRRAIADDAVFLKVDKALFNSIVNDERI